MCVSLFYVIDTGSIGSRASRVAKLGVTYLPFAFSSDAGYADLPLALLGAPVDIGALVKPGSRSLGKSKTETGRPLSRDRTTWTLSASSG